MANGKARLLREDYCDGLGDCLPACPTGAISFEMREAPAYDEAAVLAAKAVKAQGEGEKASAPCGCPGSACQRVKPAISAGCADVPSQLRNFPIQLKLVPVNAPWFDGADLLIAADCTAYAYGNFHREFMDGRVTLIGCPKLDGGSYAGKLEEIFVHNNIRSVTVTRMVVPCCGGLPFGVKTALETCGKDIPCRVVTLSANGDIID